MGDVGTLNRPMRGILGGQFPRYNESMSDLWAQKRDQLERRTPRCARAPFAGQEHFLGEGKLLRRMLEADRLTSVIFYGPPGTGKTTLAELIANHTARASNAPTPPLWASRTSASSSTRPVKHLADDGRKRILFIDEIHRFNRAQQDVLLPDVEAGAITLIGATTENPFFAVNSPLISRSQIFQFQPLSEDDVRTLLRRATSPTPTAATASSTSASPTTRSTTGPSCATATPDAR
jgi:putative ATPase